MSKRSLALLIGITGDMSFAAGCLLLALRRHSPFLCANILLYHDGTLSGRDAALLRFLGAEPRNFIPPLGDYRPEAIRKFSLLSLARFEGFSLLEDYRTVMWLDVDTAIQDDIASLVTYGPLGMALEDPNFTEAGVTSAASINVCESVPELDMLAPNFNSGVLVLRDDLPHPGALRRQCLDWLWRYGPRLKYPDQAVLNMLAQKLYRQNPGLVSVIPHDVFNAHPRNPAAGKAALVHAFGAYKLWDDGLTRCSFPEWERDYGRWVASGGSPWKGIVDNASYLEGGAFYMLRGLIDAVSSAQNLLEHQQAELEKERTLRRRLEQKLRRLSEAHQKFLIGLPTSPSREKED